MFRVGQEVVCIKDHSQGIIKKGQHFIIKGINQFGCGCIVYDLGLKTNKSRCGCFIGNHNSFKPSNGIWWISGKILSPVEDNFADQVLEKIKEQIKEEQLVENI